MNTYHWIALILALDIALILFVRGADERRSARARKSRQWRTQP
jgi:hypothetical protein